jgi:hypothetical protein
MYCASKPRMMLSFSHSTVTTMMPTIIIAIIAICVLAAGFDCHFSSVVVVVTAQERPVVPLWWHRKRIRNVTGLDEVGGLGWADSYSYKGTHCYCASSFDHNIGNVKVRTPFGRLTVKTVCDLLGPGPGNFGRPIYNDIQCGNGPANDAGDEVPCPGRVDHGKIGCKTAGPRWNFSNVTLTQVLMLKSKL